MNPELLTYRQVLFEQGFVFSPEGQISDAESAKKTLEEEIAKFDINKRLKQIREALPEKLRKPVVLTSIEISESTTIMMERMADMSLKSGKIENFLVWMDLSFGAGQVTGTLQSAITGLWDAPGDDNHIIESIGITEPAIMHDDHSAGASHQAEVYLYLQRLNKAAMRLLVEDETGFKLAEEVVKFVKGEENRLSNASYASFCMPFIERRGAEFATATYKKIYSIADSLFSEG